MASVSIYLNFTRDCEAAFEFYRTVFGTDYATPIRRFGGMPPQPGGAPASDADKNRVLHVALPILGGHVLMGSDCPESMGMKLNAGNNVYIALAPDTRPTPTVCSTRWPKAARPRCHCRTCSGATISAA